MINKKQVLVIHGGSTHTSYENYLNTLKNKNPKLEWNLSKRGWKDNLQDRLGHEYLVYTPQMPNKTNAQYDEWKIWFEKIATQLDDDFILIGHSLGGIFVVKYLSENVLSKKIKKLFLISAPFNSEDLGKEGLLSFERKADLKNLSKQVSDIFVYHSKDDPEVPFSHLERYSKDLPGANIRALDTEGHFLGESIPGLVEDIKS